MSTMILSNEHHLFVAAIAAYYGEIMDSEILPWAGLLKHENIRAYNDTYADGDVKLSAVMRVSQKQAKHFVELARAAGESLCWNIVNCYQYQTCENRRWKSHEETEGRIPSMTKMLIDSLMGNIMGEIKYYGRQHEGKLAYVDGWLINDLSKKLGGAA